MPTQLVTVPAPGTYYMTYTIGGGVPVELRSLRALLLVDASSAPAIPVVEIFGPGGDLAAYISAPAIQVA